MRTRIAKIVFASGILLVLIGCASTVQQTEPAAECQSGEFRGFGVGENESEALTEAHSAWQGR